jgi:hypothetical protein
MEMMRDESEENAESDQSAEKVGSNENDGIDETRGSAYNKRVSTASLSSLSSRS